MARVAIAMVGSQDLLDGAFQTTVSALAARIDVLAVGPVVREGGRAALALTARTTAGPVALDELLEGIGLRQGPALQIFAYGALAYRSAGLRVPPDGAEWQAAPLSSLAQADPLFEIPGFGRVGSHLRNPQPRQG